MLKTYKAILRGDRVQWLGEVPETNGGVTVHVTVLAEPAVDEVKSQPGAAMAAIMQKIADAGGIPEIPNPTEWQRETRKDRPLPGRDE